MKASTKRILSMGFAALFFIAVLVVYSNFIRPELVKIEKQRALVISKETLFLNQQTAVEQVQKLINQFQGIAQLQEVVSLAMPREENVTAILNQLQAIAKNAQVTVVSFSVSPLPFEPTKQPLAKRLGTLELNLILQGPYDAIKNFLRFLETNVRVVNIENFRISPASSSGSSDSYILTIKAEAYYQE